ncbi:hypothetical protein OBBRIDRAFT_723121 [Obba rivulosa]|uniref:GATA-type domain-containing protein n=1 Tax=Obba rivulosa TaxID=1052685 RepID=A0A8E2DR50_9APHY|nr:hypothetical protein OBBRIDRAFT_723121 [Obba rivulosa]
MQSFHSPPNYKSSIDLHVPRNIFAEHPGDEHGIVPELHTLEAAHTWNAPYPGSYHPGPGSRGSLLEELYDHDLDHNMAHDVYDHPHSHHQSAEPVYQSGGWSTHGDPHIAHQPMRHVHDVAMTRRATFPYVRQDRGEAMYTPPPSAFMGGHDSLNGSPYGSRPGTMYSEPLSMDGSPHLMGEPLHHGLDEPFAHSVSMHSSPHLSYHDFHHSLDIKTEDAPVMVPSQTYCRPPSAGMHPLPCLSPHAGLLVQHTDDAASKETQYLRRRCFNCHTTEPPSWRRSTLNPGKIVCNKCGLYERTHLRPRPLRFDELRAGSKTRKQPKVGSPKAGKMTQMVKKEPGEGESPMMPRRSSVSSSASSVHSASSDWDDNVSAYSGSSAPPSSYNSPAASTFPIPRDSNSQSPPLPRDGGIRLPNTPLSDIASLQHPSGLPSPPMPRKSATAPTPFYSQQVEMYSRHGSLPPDMQRQAAPAPLDVPIPEVTGWQSMPLSDLSSAKPMVKSRSNSLHSVAA